MINHVIKPQRKKSKILFFINKNDSKAFNKIHKLLIINIIIVNKNFFINNYYFKLQTYI